MKRVVSLLLALMFLPQFAVAAGEKWFDWYNKGVAEVRSERYKEGADSLQRAIAEMPAESTAARTGNVIITYVPHFWLGIARYNLGDVDAALREWKTSEEQGAVQNTQYFGSLREWVARANSQKQRNAETGAAESRKAANAAVGRALDGQAEALSAGADRSDSYRAAQRKLQEALDTFNKAGTDVGVYRHASELATQARDLFSTSAEAAKKEKASRPQPPKPQPREIVIPVPMDETPQPRTQTTLVTQTAAPKPEPPRIQPVPVKPAPQPVEVESEALVSARVAVQVYKRHLLDAKLSTRVAQVLEQRLDSHPNEAEIARVRDDVERGEKALAEKTAKPVAPVPVPLTPPVTPPITDTGTTTSPATGVNPLLPAWRAFAAGDLSRADALLSDLVSSGATADAYMLRGCTRWTRATLARNGDVSAAESDFRAALKLNRALRLDPATFSPKLVAFFEQVRRGM